MIYAGLELVQKESGFYFELPALAETHDPKGADMAKLAVFIERHGLTESKSKKHPVWAALLPLPLQRTMREKGTNEFYPVGEFEVMGKVHDHYALYLQQDRYIYTTQPYDLSLDKYMAVEAAWRTHGLFVDISYHDAWWYPGHTPLVVISQFPIELTK